MLFAASANIYKDETVGLLLLRNINDKFGQGFVAALHESPRHRGDRELLHIFQQVLLAVGMFGGVTRYFMTCEDPAKKKLSRWMLFIGIFSGTAFVWPYIFGW
jgi:hypothetical protein